MLSKTAIHGLKALQDLAEHEGELQGAVSIAKRIGAPPNYLGKLLQTLAQAELVYSQKGKGGGFQLAREPEEISLFDIVEPFDRVSRWEGCFMGKARCSSENPCAMHGKWAVVRDAYLDLLHTSTLADVVAGFEVGV